MHEPIETLTSPCGRYRVDIFPDDDPPNPRLEWDNVCTLLCWHSRYNLGDPSPVRDGPAVPHQPWPYRYRDRDFLEGKKEDSEGHGRSALGPGITLPLYLYDHSGLTISTGPFSCPWDSGQVGWIHCAFEKANHSLLSHPLIYPRRSKSLRQKMLDCMKAEVETYDQYLRGEVYGYLLIDKTMSVHDERVVLDSCYGIFGLDYVSQEAQSLLDRYSRQVPTA